VQYARCAARSPRRALAHHLRHQGAGRAGLTTDGKHRQRELAILRQRGAIVRNVAVEGAISAMP